MNCGPGIGGRALRSGFRLGLVCLGGLGTWTVLASGSPPGSAVEQPVETPQSPVGECDPPAINGVYALGFQGRPYRFLRPYLENPDLDGLSLRAGWSEVEPAEGAYDWSLFDPVIAHAVRHAKKVMLRVLPGARTPEWVYAAGAARFEFVDGNRYHDTYGRTLAMPVPWDPVYLSKWERFIAAFGAKYADHPAVTIVAVTGPAVGGEMHLADKRNAAAWHAVGYSNASLIDSWKRTIDAFRAAFPCRHLTVALAKPVDFGRPAEVVDAVVRHCALRRVGLQGNWLSAKTSPSFHSYAQVARHSAAAPVGFQMLCSASRGRFGGKLSQAIDSALNAQASFLELYRLDLARYPQDVAFAHARLTRRATSRPGEP